MAERGFHSYLLALPMSNAHASGCWRPCERSDLDSGSVHSCAMLGELVQWVMVVLLEVIPHWDDYHNVSKRKLFTSHIDKCGKPKYITTSTTPSWISYCLQPLQSWRRESVMGQGRGGPQVERYTDFNQLWLKVLLLNTL